MRHPDSSTCETPAKLAARAIGKTGKRNLAIPEVAPIPRALANHTVRDARHTGVLRTARIISGTKTSTSGPRNSQKSACDPSKAANIGNLVTCQRLRESAVPVDAWTAARKGKMDHPSRLHFARRAKFPPRAPQKRKPQLRAPSAIPIEKLAPGWPQRYNRYILSRQWLPPR